MTTPPQYGLQVGGRQMLTQRPYFTPSEDGAACPDCKGPVGPVSRSNHWCPRCNKSVRKDEAKYP